MREPESVRAHHGAIEAPQTLIGTTRAHTLIFASKAPHFAGCGVQVEFGENHQFPKRIGLTDVMLWSNDLKHSSWPSSGLVQVERQFSGRWYW